jgi:phage recombination protein Bet
MVIDYCRARSLDPLKKPCHIVPMQVKVGRDYEWRDVILPGIYELRTTAMRTGLYLGHSKPEYGESAEFMGVMAPAWCDLVIYRWNDAAKLRGEFPVRVYFAEVCGTTWDKEAKAMRANARWSKAPVQMMVKCAEAAGLREAFPDELGGQMTVEEMEGQRQVIDVTPDEDREQETDLGPAKVGAVKMRKIVDGLNEAAGKQDAVTVKAIRAELNNAEWLLVWRQLRSWERSAITKALEAAKSLPQGDDLDAWALEAIRTAKDQEALGAAWRAVEDMYAEKDTQVPDSVATACDTRRGEL